ncbi:Major facilitator superfamily transporter [Madurella fahalii]|uniref:Major facilitator superfamily transporter n=1 Tax=Madurella fahalii TaxID=1157608 RepID=A0ABQ0GMP8_9PEZI
MKDKATRHCKAVSQLSCPCSQPFVSPAAYKWHSSFAAQKLNRTFNGFGSSDARQRVEVPAARNGGSGDEEDQQTNIGEDQSLPLWKWTILILGVAFGLFLSILDSAIVATSLVSISAEFGDVGSINWVALAYTLTYLSCAVLFARISDVVGRRAAFVAAYSIFIVFSVACGFSQSMPQLIAFRALQGLGGSGLYSISMVILPEVTPARRQQFIGAIVAIVLTSSGVLGPVLGGILTQYANWRWVFWINGPVGSISLFIFLFAWEKRQLPAPQRRSWRDVDYVGSLLLVAAAVLIVFPFQNSSKTAQWTHAIFLAPLITGLFALAALFVWQHFIEHYSQRKLAAAFPPVLLNNRVYTATAIHTMLTGFPYLLSVYAFPVRFQVVYGRNALGAGVMLLPMLATSAMATLASGALNSKRNRLVETLVVGCVLMLLGCGLETMSFDTGGMEFKMMGYLTFIRFGFGLSASAGTIIAATESPVREHATAQGIIAQARVFGGSLGIAASSTTLGVKAREELALAGMPPETFANMALEPSQFSTDQ